MNQVTRERAQSLLTEEHIACIVQAYERFENEPGFARVASREEIRAKDGNLSIPLYVTPAPSLAVGEERTTYRTEGLQHALDGWLASRQTVAESLRAILPDLTLPGLNGTSKGLATCGLFDRSAWQSVRLGDVVKNLNETERDAAGAGIERFIGLEHLEPGSLHIRAWGNVAEGTTFTRRCRPGQVLFGKRRAYQRKVAVAEFDAVVSGDIYVFEPKDERLLRELLPLLCMSGRFFQFAVETSAGSLSPRTNWSHLAQFEFALPPLDQQRHIADILWALDANLQGWSRTALAADKQCQAAVAAFLSKHECSKARLGDYLEEIQYGSSSKAMLHPAAGLVPLLRIPNVIGGRVDFADLVWLEPSTPNEKYRLVPGDVLIVRTNGNPDYVGRTAVYEGAEFGECLFASYLIRLRPKPYKLLPRFLHEMLQSQRVKRDLRKQVRSSAGNYNLNTEGIFGLRIPIPSLAVQQQLLGQRAVPQKVVDAATRHLGTIRTLQLQLLTSIVGM